MNSFGEVWSCIISLEGSEFQQVRGKQFTYTVKGEYIIPNTTRIRIPKSYFEKAWNRMPLTGPGAVQDLIAPSYLFAVLTDPRIWSERPRSE
jgi:hypothetical protein